MVSGHRSSTDVLSSSKAGGEFLHRASRGADGRDTFSHKETRDGHRSASCVFPGRRRPRVRRGRNINLQVRTTHSRLARGPSPAPRTDRRRPAASPPSTAGRSFSAIALSASTRPPGTERSGRVGEAGSPTKRGLSDSVRARPGRRCRSARASSGRRRRSATARRASSAWRRRSRAAPRRGRRRRRERRPGARARAARPGGARRSGVQVRPLRRRPRRRRVSARTPSSARNRERVPDQLSQSVRLARVIPT